MGSDLSYEDEKRIYEHLLTLYKPPEWVVVWRGDTRKGGNGNHDYDNDDYWYHKTSGVDYEIYKVDGNVTVPDETTEEQAKDLLKELRLFINGAIAIETKKRTLLKGEFPQYGGLYINNHINPTDKKRYPAGDKYPTPPDTISVSDYGKLKKMERFAKKGADTYFVIEDGRTGKCYVAHLTSKYIKDLEKQAPGWTAHPNKLGPRWEKNYDIDWHHFAIITGNNWDLETYFINGSENPKDKFKIPNIPNIPKPKEQSNTVLYPISVPRQVVANFLTKGNTNVLENKEVYTPVDDDTYLKYDERNHQLAKRIEEARSPKTPNTSPIERKVSSVMTKEALDRMRGKIPNGRT